MAGGLLCSILLSLCPLHAQDESFGEPGHDSTAETTPVFQLRGLFKDLYTQIKTDAYSRTGEEKLLVADLKRFRLSPELNLSDILIVHVDYDNEIISGNYLKSREFDAFWRYPESNDLFDLSWEPYYTEDLYYRTKIHRAYAKLSVEDLTVTVGRQLIRFGSGRLWNPLDILNPISPMSIESVEEREGESALRMEYYPGREMEISLVVDARRTYEDGKPGDVSAPDSNVIGRARMTVGETEIAAMGGRVSRRAVGGADVSLLFLDGMLRGSALYNDPEEGASYLLGSAGYEYTFAFGLYFLCEYFYNQNALNFNDRLERAYNESQVFGLNRKNFSELSNQFLTLNQHYTGLALGYDITPLLRGDVLTMYDFQGRGLYLGPSLKYNPFQDLDISGGIMASHIFEGGRTSDFEMFWKKPLVYASLVWYF